MTFITNAIADKFEALTWGFNNKVDVASQKIDSVKSAISTAVESYKPAVRKWGPAALGAAVFTYMFPYFVGTMALAAGLGLYYGRSVQDWTKGSNII